MTDDLRANNTARSNTIQFYNTTQATVNDNISVAGTLAADTLTSKPAANPTVVNDSLAVNSTLIVDTITKRLATEVTVDNDLAVGGTLLGDTIDASSASQLSIKDNVVVVSATADKNLTVYGNLSLSGSLLGYSPFRVAGRMYGTTSPPIVFTRKGDKGSELARVKHTGRTTGV